MSLRLRLALWWGGLTGLVILVVGVLTYASEGLALYNALDSELRSAAQRAAVTRLPAARNSQGSLVLAATDWVGIVVRLHGPGGEVLAASPNAVLAPDVDPARVLADPPRPAYDRIVELAPPYVTVNPGGGSFGLHSAPNGVRWRVYVLPLASGAHAVATAPLRDVDTAIANTRRMIPLLASAAAATMLVAGLFLAGRALRPVAVLTETAGEIAAARAFDRRVAVGNAHDELGKMATTFNAMLDSLQQAYRSQQRFAADASHELRTPLTAIQANLELIERQPGMPTDERRDAMREALRETRRLVRLVARLLALARADAGAAPVRKPVELDRVALDAFNEARLLADGHQLSVDAVEPAAVEGDPDQLKQLLLILLDNALKYTPAGGTVRLRLAGVGPWAELTVRDSGAGIAADELRDVFDRFYRGANARARHPSGSGLGLSIARAIARQHGGDVSLSSENGRGTMATVRLPLTSPAGHPGRQPPRRVPMPAAAPGAEGGSGAAQV